MLIVEVGLRWWLGQWSESPAEAVSVAFQVEFSTKKAMCLETLPTF